MKKPTSKQLEKALRELNDAVNFGLFNALSRKEIDDQPAWKEIERKSNKAERLLKACKLQ